MMRANGDEGEEAAVFNYHLLRNSLDTYRKNLTQLDADEQSVVRRKAQKSFEIESLVLASPEAGKVQIGAAQLDRSLREVAERYADEQDLQQDLQANGLTLDVLRRALHRELLFDGVMQYVASRSAEISEVDMRLFYEMHRQRFSEPERRVASHILITINEDFAENNRVAARCRIDRLLEKLAGRGNRFRDFARRYSECPSAMEGGRLGEILKGQLYPQLDQALFAMAEGAISPVLESPLGFHILYCEKIKAGRRQPFSKAAPRIRELLLARQQRNCQKVWLSELRNDCRG
jgi:peptidyl-prolyl cis-trans isomerase C